MDHRSRLIEEYWWQKLSKPLEMGRLPTHAGVAELSETDSEVVLAMPESVSNLLQKATKSSPSGAFILMLSGVVVLCARYSGLVELALGTVAPSAKNKAGRLLFCRHRVHDDQSFGTLLSKCKKAVLETFNYAEFDLAGVLEPMAVTQPDQLETLFQFAFVHHPFQPRSQSLAKFGLVIHLEEDGAGWKIRASGNPSVWHPAILRQFLENLIHFIEHISGKMAIQLREMTLVAPAEKEVLASFSGNRSDYSKNATIHQWFESQVLRAPDRIAVMAGKRVRSYLQLDLEANQLAILMCRHKVGLGDVVAIMVEPSPDMVVGLLAILKLGCCYLPIRPDFPLARKQYLLADSDARMLLTESALLEDHQILMGSDQILCLDEPRIKKVDVSPWQAGQTALGLAKVIYTSGTTGHPKGVMITHQSILRLIKNANYFTFKENDRLLFSGTLEFDSSAFEIWGPLLHGGAVFIGEKAAYLAPSLLKGLIEKNAISVMWMTAPLFSHFSREEPQMFAPLHTLLVGGDVVSPTHVEVVRHKNPHLKIINGYGPTENATFSTTHHIDRKYGKRVPIGRPIANSTAYVVDKWGRLQPMGVVGELWLGGDGLARGYLAKPSLTAEKFIPCHFENRVYLTGDLARWLADGTLDFLGRSDDQLKIRGYRVEPGEIETHLLGHAQVEEAIVLPIEDGEGLKTLCAYLVAPALVDVAELKGYLHTVLPEYMVPTHIMCLAELPLNPHGKVNRKALPQPNIEAGGAVDLPRGPREEKMAELWSRILGCEGIGRDQNFFDLGGHSMLAIQLMAKIHKIFDVKIGLKHFMRAPTVAKISQFVAEARQVVYKAIEKAPPRAFDELSTSQKRVIEVYQSDPQNTAFNMSFYRTWDAPPVLACIVKTVTYLVERHLGLRTYFPKQGRRFVSVIDPVGVPILDVIQLAGLPSKQKSTLKKKLLQDLAQKPICLEELPLCNMKLLDCGDSFVLALAMHHIVADGWSLQVLDSEFKQLYVAFQRGETPRLLPLQRQYRDYVAWHNRLLADEDRIKPTADYWRQLLTDPPSLLPLAYDRKKKASGIGRSSSGYRVVLPQAWVTSLKKLAGDQETSFFFVLLAGFHALLHQLTGQTDIVTGIPSTNRDHEDFKNVIGFFVDPLILRTQFNPDEGFTNFLKRLTRMTLETLEYAHYPIELAAATVGKTWPDMLSTFFNMTPMGGSERLSDLGRHHIERVPNAKMEFALYLSEYQNGLEINTHYYNELFDGDTIEAWLDQYLQILETIVS